MKTCFGYVRVSTVKQGDGVSLEAQRDAIRAFASRNNLTVKEWFEEKETAAKRGRPVFNKMISELKRRKADGVIFHKIDRSARNFADWARIGDLAEAGIDVHFATESLDFRSRGGRLAADIQAVVAADYIRNLRDESIKGQIGRLKQGFYPYSAPVGYRNEGAGKPKSVDPIMGPLVRQLFELYATGQHSFLSLQAIMKERGLRSSIGRPVSRTGIEHILTNPFYTGLIRIRRSGETYMGCHEPIISKRLYEQAEDVRLGRRRKVKVMHDYLFRGLFLCGLCNRAMIGERQKGHVYYRCQGKGCATKSIREEVIDEAVRLHIRDMELTDHHVERLRTMLYDWLKNEARHATSSQAIAEIASIEERLSRLTDKFVDDLIDRETYTDKREELLRERLRLQNLLSDQHTWEWHVQKICELLERAKSLCVGYENANRDEKRAIVRFADSNRFVSGKNVLFEPPNWRQKAEMALDCHASAPTPPSTRTDRVAELVELVREVSDEPVEL